jgi:hypothetical protein
MAEDVWDDEPVEVSLAPLLRSRLLYQDDDLDSRFGRWHQVAVSEGELRSRFDAALNHDAAWLGSGSPLAVLMRVPDSWDEDVIVAQPDGYWDGVARYVRTPGTLHLRAPIPTLPELLAAIEAAVAAQRERHVFCVSCREMHDPGYAEDDLCMGCASRDSGIVY